MENSEDQDAETRQKLQAAVESLIAEKGEKGECSRQESNEASGCKLLS